MCGPPGAGKTAYVETNKRPGDMAIDVDQIIAEMSGTRTRTWASRRYLVDALAERNAGLKMLGTEPGCSAAWFIVTAARGGDREGWARKLDARRVVVVATDVAECIRRINADANRAFDVRPHMVRAVHEWWDAYSERADDEVITERLGKGQKGYRV